MISEVFFDPDTCILTYTDHLGGEHVTNLSGIVAPIFSTTEILIACEEGPAALSALSEQFAPEYREAFVVALVCFAKALSVNT